MLRHYAFTFLTAMTVGAAQAPSEGPGCGGPGGGQIPPPLLLGMPGPMPCAGGGPVGPMGPMGPGFMGRGGPGGEKGAMPGPMMAPMFHFLKLSAEQKQSMAAVLAKHQPAMRAKHQALAAKGKALRDGMDNPALSEAQLRTLAAAESEARLQCLLEGRASFLEMHALLSKDQQAKAERLRITRQKEQEAHQAFMAEAEEE